MGKSETKFNNTAKKMNAAMIELLEEKEFEEINVMELCERAGVNRSTFYSHYNNTRELLEEVHNFFNNELYKSYSVEEQSANQNIASVLEEELVTYLEFIQSHRTFFMSYMDHLGNFKRDEFYTSIKKSALIPMLKHKNITDETTINLVSQFYLQGIAAIIKDWIYNNCVEDVTYIAETILLCTKLTLE